MELIKPPLHPDRFPDELPYGYLKRLAELNQYESPTWLFRNLSSRCVLQTPALSVAELSAADWAGNQPTASAVGANTQHLRYCPLCIAERGYWRSAWQSWVSCACTKHQIWLVDRCPSCHSRLPLASTNLSYCACGARLADAPAEIIDSPIEQMQLFLDEGSVPDGAYSILPMEHGLDYPARTALISLLCNWLDYPKLTVHNFNRELKQCGTARIHLVNAAELLFQPEGLDTFLFRLSQLDSPEYYTSLILKFVLRLNIDFPQPCFDTLKHQALSYWVYLRKALDQDQGRSSDIADLWEYAEWQVLPHDPK